jgi:cytochrome P450 family 4
VQKKVVEEIDGILGQDAERRFTRKDLNEMKYLECCVKEALRLYPSVPVIARQIKEDLNIGTPLPRASGRCDVGSGASVCGL